MKIHSFLSISLVLEIYFNLLIIILFFLFNIRIKIYQIIKKSEK